MAVNQVINRFIGTNVSSALMSLMGYGKITTIAQQSVLVQY